MKQWILSFGTSDLARGLAVLADPWTLLILDAAYDGTKRFEQFLDLLPISRAVLSNRLDRMEQHGLLRRDAYQAKPIRHEYILTAAGADAVQVLVAAERWSERRDATAKYTSLTSSE